MFYGPWNLQLESSTNQINISTLLRRCSFALTLQYILVHVTTLGNTWEPIHYLYSTVCYGTDVYYEDLELFRKFGSNDAAVDRERGGRGLGGMRGGDVLGAVEGVKGNKTGDPELVFINILAQGKRLVQN